jgi:hypothetical protein
MLILSLSLNDKMLLFPLSSDFNEQSKIQVKQKISKIFATGFDAKKYSVVVTFDRFGLHETGESYKATTWEQFSSVLSNMKEITRYKVTSLQTQK